MSDQHPDRPDPPLFAPVVFDDDDDGPPRGRFQRERDLGGRGPSDYDSDATLFRVLGIILVAGIVVLALVLPWSPISLFGGSGDDTPEGISTQARDTLPDLPAGLVALSKMYDIQVPEGEWTVEIVLDQATEDGRNIGFYTHQDGRWVRVSAGTLSEDGRRASGLIDHDTHSIAVLRREALAATLGVIVDAGQAPETAALQSASASAVRASSLGEDGTLEVDDAALTASRGAAADVAVYFGVTGEAAAVAAILADAEGVASHVDAIVSAARAQRAQGVYLEYTGLDAAQRAAFTEFVSALAGALRGDGLALTVAVSGTAATDGGAYDWSALLAAADALWLRPESAPRDYYREVEALLNAQREAGVDLRSVSLVLDRRSSDGMARVSLRDALAVASVVDRGIGGAIAAGDPVTLRAVHLEADPRGPALHWDDAARAVTFTYSADGGPRDAWLENRFSVAFRLDLAQRHGLAGVVVDPAHADEGHADLWEPVLAFVQDGDVRLERPYGPYLVPCWQASEGSIEGASECWTEDHASDAIVWRAPARPGVFDIRLVVSDGTLFVAQELALRVTDDGTAPAPTPTPTPEPTPTPDPTATPEPTPDPTPTPEPDPTASPTPSPTPEPTPTPDPDPEPEDDGVPPGPAGND